jgi:hypothetical protein
MRRQTEGGLAARSGRWAQSTGWAGLAYECWQLGKACWKQGSIWGRNGPLW